MEITEMSKQHLINSINYHKRILANKPPHGVYTGISDYGDQMVEMENMQNDEIEEEIKDRITKMEKQLLTK